MVHGDPFNVDRILLWATARSEVHGEAMTYGSLFTGCGGFDMGFDAAGLDCRWQCEIENHPAAVLRRHWPDVKKYHDVREIDTDKLGPVDVVVGGFPCQDLSLAGNREGLSGARSGLFYELVRVAVGVRCSCVVLENVPGLFSSDQGRDFARVLGHLHECGFNGGWRVLDAEGFGVAQSRRRFFGVFVKRGLGIERVAKILALTSGLRGNPAEGSREGKDVAGTLGAGTSGSGFPVDLDRCGGIAYQCHGTDVGWFGTLRRGNGGGASGGAPFVGYGGNRTSGSREKSSALRANGGTGHGDFESETFVMSDAVGYRTNSAGQTCDQGDRSASLTTGTDGTSHIVAFQSTFGRNGRWAPSETVRTLLGSADGGRTDKMPNVMGAGSLRRMTPIEWERLMGWPDDHTRYRDDGKEIADGPRYRMIGNGVVKPVAKWLGERVRMFL